MLRTPIFALALPAALAVAALLVPVSPTVAQDSTDPSADPPVRQTVEIGRSGGAAGQRVTQNLQMNNSASIAVSVGGQVMQKLEQVAVDTTNYVADILETDDEGITKLLITFVADESSMSRNGMEEAAKGPNHGNSYICTIDHENDTQTIVRADGDEMSDEEAEGAENEISDVLNGSGFSRALPEGAIAVGGTVELDAEALADAMNAEGDSEASGTMTLVRVYELNGRQTAEFKAALKLIGKPDESISVELDMTGLISLDVETGVQVATNATGPSKISGGQQTPDGQKIDISGEGSITVKGNGSIGDTPDEEDGDDE